MLEPGGWQTRLRPSILMTVDKQGIIFDRQVRESLALAAARLTISFDPQTVNRSLGFPADVPPHSNRHR